MKKIRFTILVLVVLCGFVSHAFSNNLNEKENSSSLFKVFKLYGSDNSSFDLLTDDGISYSLDGILLRKGFYQLYTNFSYWGLKNGNSTETTGFLFSNEFGRVQLLESGIYNLTFNIETGAYSFKLLNTVPERISITDRFGEIGEMSSIDGINYTLKNTFFYIRPYAIFNKDSNLKYFSSSTPTFPKGISSVEGTNEIEVLQKGYYDVTFNLQTGEYNFMLITAVPESISLVSNRTDMGDFQTNDGINYFINSILLISNTYKFSNKDRAEDYYSENPSTFPKGNSSINGEYEIELTQKGFYDISFNLQTGEYIFKLINIIPEEIFLRKDFVEDYNMTSTDGINYSLKNVLLTGYLGFYNNDKDEWLFSENIESFPSGISSNIGGNDIIVNQKGYYDVTFNLQTGEYEFKLLESLYFELSYSSLYLNGDKFLFSTTDGVNYFIKDVEIKEGYYLIKNNDTSEEYYANTFLGSGIASENGLSKESYLNIHAKYNILFNIQTKEYKFELLGTPLTQNELKLDFSNYPEQNKLMSTVDGGVNYTLTNQLILIDTKLRFKNQNGIIYSPSNFSEGKILKLNENDFNNTKSGYYDITFNLFTGDYKFVLKSPYTEDVSIIDANSLELIAKMQSSDGENYLLEKTYLADNKRYAIKRERYGKIEYFFNQDKIWSTNLCSICQISSPYAIPVYLEIKLNISTKELSTKKVSTYIKNYALVINNEEVSLNSTDGINYSLTEYFIDFNSILYFKNKELTSNNIYDIPVFPSGTARLNYYPYSLSTGGTYNITYNISTNNYSFTLVGQPVYEEVTLWNSTLNTDIKLKTSNGIDYTYDEALEPGLYYFKKENLPNLLLGGSEFPSGTAKDSNLGICILQREKYRLRINFNTLDYQFFSSTIENFENKNTCIVYNFIGSGSTEGIIARNSNFNKFIFNKFTTITSNSIQIEFRINDKRYTGDNFPSGNLKEISKDITSLPNLPGKSGEYAVVVDTALGSYQFYSTSNLPWLPIYFASKSNLISSILMYSEDGVNYKVENYPLNIGNYFVYNNTTTNSLSEISINDSGNFIITYNINTKQIDYVKVQDYKEKYVAYGTSMKLGELVYLETTDEVNYSFKNVYLSKGNFVLSNDNVRFETNHWISTQFPTGKLNHTSSFYQSELIQIPESGYYDFTYNNTTKEFKFTLISKATFEIVKLSGSALNGNTLYLETSDGINYQKNSVFLESGDLIVEKLSNTSGKSISSKQNSTESIIQTITVDNSGYYDIRFNNETLKIELIEKTLTVNSIENKAEFLVYPNPVTNGILYFNESANISLYDLAGRQLIIKNNSNELDVSGLSSGTYLLVTDFGKKIKVIIP